MGVSHKPIKKKNYKYQFFEWFGMVPIIGTILTSPQVY